ncbi:MAG: C39 family peptidase [Candidatus Wildermuthbacteria bacterium]|nr:C39 family peptidase [Candidatus Wildermuthbacteria bacterium]
MTKHLTVKPFRESPGMCGPASLKIVLDYYGIHASEKELAKSSGATRDRGINAEGLMKAAKRFGFKAVVKENSSFEDIEKWVKKGVPPIVDWFTAGRAEYAESDVPDGHYSVVCGIDSAYIYLQDPELERIRKIERKDFKRVWFDFKGNAIKSWKDMVIRQLIAIYPDSDIINK